MRFGPGLRPGLSDSRLRFFSRLPLALGQALPRSMGVRMGSVPNLGSTLQSLRRGQRTEIDFLNGAVVREADAAGTTAPVNAAIVEMVHEVEESGTSIGRDEVLRRVAV